MPSRIKIEAQFTGTGLSAEFPVWGRANLQLRSGAGGGGTVILEKKLKGQSTFYRDSIKDGLGTAASWTLGASATLNMVIDEPESEVTYRLQCTVFTAAIDYRVSS